jgi:putative membrane protein
MKNSVLTIFTVAAMLACKKNETTAVDKPIDSLAVSSPTNSGIIVSDSARMPINSSTANSLNNQDKKFADAAARGGLMEVMMGQLAISNAGNITVKTLGEMMVKDHGKANEELKKWGSTAGFTLPTSLDADQQKKYDDLKTKKGLEFDRKYTDLMVSDHQKDISEFKKEASEGAEASLKSFASKTIPTLEHHLMESEKAKNAVK